ncbi:MAG: hypothetical protein KA715_00155 [Xanthomonadaceae bacterium]|nr:hypothetical protein [Xanthomonadaceae bacterium]
MKFFISALMIFALSSCSTLSLKERVLIGSGIGAATGAIGGSALSPNSESQGLNALIFGLSGAIVGGAASLIFTDNKDHVSGSLRERLEQKDQSKNNQYLVQPTGKLPQFVRDRISPAVVEEAIEKDQISEDGTLHEPHKVYRIMRQAELYANPKKGEP